MAIVLTQTMKPEGAILVVGADGRIGRALADRLAGKGHAVIRTVLSPESGAEVLDLSRNAAGWTPPRPVSVAFLCAAATSLEYCRTRPMESRAVNVDGTVALARTLTGRGARVVFPSSNLVFDGSCPFARADASVCPRTEYGRQKADAERQLLELPGVCVVRLSKVLGPASPLLAPWAAALRRGEPVRPFADMVMSPVPLGFAVEVLGRVGATPMEGVLQVSAAEDISYEQAARHVAKRIRAAQELVEPVSAAGSGLPLEHLPAHTTLDTTRLRAELGLVPPEVWEAVDVGMTP